MDNSDSKLEQPNTNTSTTFITTYRTLSIRLVALTTIELANKALIHQITLHSPTTINEVVLYYPTTINKAKLVGVYNTRGSSRYNSK